jgi:hypothetical protein
VTDSPTPRWWQWPTILSLDAPLIVVLWQWVLADAARVRLGWPQRAVLGASVWLAYAADRWIEGWRLEPARIRTQRHRFYQRHRWPVAAVWLTALVVDVAVSVVQLSRREFVAGVLLLAPVAAYLLSHQLVHRDRRWRAPKEVCVAFLLGGGAALFIYAAPTAKLGASLVPLSLFVLLCFANVALISTWEHEVDTAHGQTSLARQFARAAAASRILPWILAAGALGLALFDRLAQPAAGCAAASGVALGLVDRMERSLGWRVARVLVDVALLTPLVPLLARLLR